jgi:hypothetical protein
MVWCAITAIVPIQLANCLALIQLSLGVDAAEAPLAAKGRIASISNAGKITHLMYTMKMSLGLASIASASLKITNPSEESNFALVL